MTPTKRIILTDCWLGDAVYHKASGSKGLVIGIYVTPGGTTYSVGWDDRSESSHFSVELSTTIPTPQLEEEEGEGGD
jgi:hypothetical protein